MRLKLKEITPRRIIEAAKRRLDDIPVAFAWEFSSQAKENRKSLEQYRNIHKGKRCFIIANGPSLKGMDISVLRMEYTFSMNRAYLLYDAWGFTPSYYVCVNELVLEQFAEDIAGLGLPKFVNYDTMGLFANGKVLDLLMFIRLGLSFNDRFNGDATKVLSSGGTVTYACLQLAYFMGFTEVVLIGLDHSFVEKGLPNKTLVRSEENDESHCHPNYFPKGIKWQLPDLYRSECAYSLAKIAYEADGRSIYDATVGGKCNVFQKVKFESLFP